ncbi:hypothetical protein NSQ59_04015 [Margalitia sp. FSL K6-0131]
MQIFHKVADFCWEGLTLKHISDRGIVIPYLLFLIMGVIFELFLLALVIISAYFFHIFDYQPDISYFVSIGILVFMFLSTIQIFMSVQKK